VCTKEIHRFCKLPELQKNKFLIENKDPELGGTLSDFSSLLMRCQEWQGKYEKITSAEIFSPERITLVRHT